MTVCSIKGCHNTPERQRKTNNNITFHRFPTQEGIRKKWTKIVQKTRLDEYWKPSPITVICSAHFEEDDLYQTKGGLRRVRRGAVPTKLEVKQPAKKEPDELDDINLNSSELQDVTDPENVLNNIPIVTKLKSQLHSKDEQCKKYARRIKSLVQKNKRLTITNERLKTVISILKNGDSTEDEVYIDETVVSVSLIECDP